MTEEQKNCEYCHFNSRGDDFGDDCKFQLAKYSHGGYFINAWQGLDFDVTSDYINYCPMCGRKLGKED